jgi:hypothetical protein
MKIDTPMPAAPLAGAIATPAAAPQPLVDVRGLRVTFTGGRRPVQAVDGVDLRLDRG